MEMEETIFLSAVLEKMADGKPFDVKFVTADLEKQTGGEIIELRQVRLSIAKRAAPIARAGKKKNAGTQNHWANSTRNAVLPNGLIRKFHIRLIIEFNGRKVIW